MEEDEDKTDQEFLADLAERLREVPVMYGVDGYDIDRLRHMSEQDSIILVATT